MSVGVNVVDDKLSKIDIKQSILSDVKEGIKSAIPPLLDIAESLPLAGPFAKVLKIAIKVCESHKCNQAAFEKLRARLFKFADFCFGEFGILKIVDNRTENVIIEPFVGQMVEVADKAIEEIGKFAKVGFIRSLIKGNKIQKAFDTLDAEITKSLNDLSAALQVSQLNEQAQTYVVVCDIQSKVDSLGGLQGVYGSSAEAVEGLCVEIGCKVEDLMVELRHSLNIIEDVVVETSDKVDAVINQNDIIIEQNRQQACLLDDISAKLQKQLERIDKASIESLYVMEPTPTHYLDDCSVLGRGTFGVTHRMKNTEDNGLYAVKVIRVKDALDEAEITINDIQREASILQLVSHANIVKFHTSFFTRNDSLFNLVMELIPGGSLAKRMKKGFSVRVELIVKWFGQIASALRYLHFDKNIQHRDIKPENILLTANDDIKIIDLGLACFVKETTVTSKIGTLLYYSYEKAGGLKYDGRDDVWAAGCVMAELLSGSRFKDRSWGALYMFSNAEVNSRRLQLLSECVGVDARLGGIIGRMLEPEQGNRCNSKQLCELLAGNEVDDMPMVTADTMERYAKLSFYDLLPIADGGDVIAQFLVSQKYSAGFEVAKNSVQAFRYAKMAADQGHAEAQVYVGKCYFDGDGVEMNKDEAFKYFKLSADQGNAVAQRRVGYCYIVGFGVYVDSKLAFHYYKQSADQGDMVAMLSLAVCYRDGKGVNRDVKEAFRLFKELADKGHGDGLAMVGFCNLNGTGTEKDFNEALKFLEQSAKLQISSGQYGFGLCYYHGHGVTVDKTKAFEYFKLSADQNDPDACYYLGVMYDRGESVQVDKLKAFDYFKRAADQGSANSQKEVAIRYHKGIGVKANETEGDKYMKLYEANANNARGVNPLDPQCTVS